MPMQIPQPLGLRLNLSPNYLSGAPHSDPYRMASGEASPRQSTSISRIKLFESGQLAASLGSDGRIHYRLPTPRILGTRLGGQISTNSAMLTLTWPPKD